MNSLLASNITLDIISILHEQSYIDEFVFNAFVEQLTTLQSSAFFQQLHLYFNKYDVGYQYPAHLMSVVRILHIIDAVRIFYLSSLVNLKHLYILNTSRIQNMDHVLTKLNQLINLNFYIEAIDGILKLCSLPNLESIKIKFLKLGQHFNHDKNIVNSTVINEERKKCRKPSQQLMIYLEEEIFLATKSAFDETKFQKIKIMRHALYDYFLDFYWN